MERKNRGPRKLTPLLIAVSFLFTSLSAPFAQAKQNSLAFTLRNRTQAAFYNPQLVRKIVEKSPAPHRQKIHRIFQDKYEKFGKWGQVRVPVPISQLRQLLLDPNLHYALLTFGIVQFISLGMGHSPSWTNIGIPFLLAHLVTSALPGDKPDPLSPTPKTVSESRAAFTYPDPETGEPEWIDLDHYIYAQKLLAGMEEEERISSYGIYKDRYVKFTKDLIDSINGNRFKPQKTGNDISAQNDSPRNEAILQAIMNSLTALGLDLSQFGKGVKQIVEWLEPNGEDRIDIYTASQGKAYHQALLKSRTGQIFIRPVKEIEHSQFQEKAANDYASGTVLKVTVKNPIPRTKTDLLGKVRQNSQAGIEKLIHEKFLPAAGIKITTHLKWSRKGPKELNGVQRNILTGEMGTVPEGTVPISPGFRRNDEKGEVSVIFTDHSIIVADNGIGMDFERSAKMWVPKYGSSNPDPLDEDGVKNELLKVQAIEVEPEEVEEETDNGRSTHLRRSAAEDRVVEKEEKKKKISRTVSYYRGGRMIVSFPIPEEIVETSVPEGNLILEGGALFDVPESWDKIIIPKDPSPNHPSNFRQAIEKIVENILQMPEGELPKLEKLKAINAIAIGLDSLIQNNKENEQTVKAVQQQMKKRTATLVEELKKEGTLFLPHHKQFEQLKIPDGVQPLFLHPNLFNWEGLPDILALGGELVPGITLGGKPLVVIPFKEERLKFVEKLYNLWHELLGKERIPMIKTEWFVAIPVEKVKRLLELARIRTQRQFTPAEEREFRSHLVKVKNVTAEKLSSKKHKVEDYMRVAPVSELPEGDEIDKDFREKFLLFPFGNKLVPGTGRKMGRVPEGTVPIFPATPPPNANAKHILLKNGKVIKVGSGTEIEMRTEENLEILNMTPLRNGFYLVQDYNPKMVKVIGLSKKPSRVVYIERGQAQNVLPESEAIQFGLRMANNRMIVSPDKKFVYNGYNLVLNLGTGEIHYLNNDFSTEIKLYDEPMAREPHYWNVQFSPDGKYLTYFENESSLQPSYFVAVDLASGQLIKRVPLRDGNDKYTFNRYNPVIVYIKNSVNRAAPMTLVDLSYGAIDAEVLHGAQFLHPDPSGSYTSVFRPTLGRFHMDFYIHKSHQMIRGDSFGSTFSKAETRFLDGETKIIFDLYSADAHTPPVEPGYSHHEESSFANRLFILDSNGEIEELDRFSILLSDSKEDPDRQRGYFSEIVTDDGQVKFSTTKENSVLIKNFAIQRLDNLFVYKHPKFNLIIDESDPRYFVAIDPKRGDEFRFQMIAAV